MYCPYSAFRRVKADIKDTVIFIFSLIRSSGVQVGYNLAVMKS